MPLHTDSDPYRSPVLYDLEYEDHNEDIAHYIHLSKQMRGPVLELGCGTGRVMLPLARAGIEIDGVDLAEKMLDHLGEKLKTEPPQVQERVRFFKADFRTFEPDRRYPLVIFPFNSIHHCGSADDVRAVFENVKHCLLRGGLFAFDCYLPDPTLYSRDPAKKYEFRDYTDPRDGRKLTSWEQGWWDEKNQIHHVTYSYQREDGQIDTLPISLRMYKRHEMLNLIREAGFEIMVQGSDFVGSPITHSSLKWVLVLREKGQARAKMTISREEAT